MAFIMQTSIHGRRLGISSTGGIVSGYGSTGNVSTDFVAVAVMRDSNHVLRGPHYEPVTTHSSSGATMAEGLNYIASATAAAYAFSMPAASSGLIVRIGISSSASTITFSGSATTILFGSTVVGGSTSLTASNAGGCQGMYLTLAAMTTARWAVMNKSIAVAATSIELGIT